MVNIIVAVGNYVSGKGFPIGKNGLMPWNNKKDLKWFKDTTTGHPIIMGRKTFESIGHPLPNRTNIIVSSTSEMEEKYNNEITVISDVERAIDYAKQIDDEIFIIGGAKLYKYALENDLVDRVLIDVLAEQVDDADTFFPDIITDNNWEEVGSPIEIENRKAYVLTYVKLRGKNNNVDEQYLNLVNDIIENGEHKDTRAGKTRSLFGKQLRFNLKEGLPILTTKKVFTKGIIHELLWFLKGDTNIKYLVDNGVHIWDDDAYRYYLELMKKYGIVDPTGIKIKVDNPVSKELFLELVKNGQPYNPGERIGDKNYTFYRWGDIGPVYGKQWTDWNGINQVKELIEKLKTNPDDRRLMISAWNVSDIPNMALPPCHYTMQFYTKKMSVTERMNWAKKNFTTLVFDNFYNKCITTKGDDENIGKYLDELNVPSRKLSCMFNMRSVDSLLGLPFNILSYSVLTHLIAQCCNMDVDELIFSGGDVHVYENQIETYEKEQKNNNPHKYALPKLVLNKNIKNIEDFTYDDIKIVDYESYPSIKYPLSVGL